MCMTPFAIRTLPAIVSNAKPSLNTSRKSSEIRRGSACSESTPSSLPTPGSIFVNWPAPTSTLEVSGQLLVVEVGRRARPAELARRASRARPSRRPGSPMRVRNALVLLDVDGHVELASAAGVRSGASVPSASTRPASLISENRLTRQSVPSGRADELHPAEIACARDEALGAHVELGPRIRRSFASRRFGPRRLGRRTLRASRAKSSRASCAEKRPFASTEPAGSHSRRAVDLARIETQPPLLRRASRGKRHRVVASTERDELARFEVHRFEIERPAPSLLPRRQRHWRAPAIRPRSTASTLPRIAIPARSGAAAVCARLAEQQQCAVHRSRRTPRACDGRRRGRRCRSRRRWRRAWRPSEALAVRP